MAKMTIKDIAKLTNVSVATVSRYINGQTKRMSPATAQRIAAIIKKYDFIPNKAAQQLKLKKTGLIGVMIANIDDNFATEVFNGADAILQTVGYDAILVNAGDSLEREATQMAKLRRQQIDGLILQPLVNQTAHYNKLMTQALPTVLVDRYTLPYQWPSVTSNNFDVGQALAHVISSKKYQQVIIYTENPQFVTSRYERIQGLQSALKTTTLKIIIKQISAKDFNQAQNYTELKALTNNFQIKTAIIALKEELLIQILALINFYQLKYPTQIGITGFADSPMLAILAPDLTLVSQGPYAIGAIAAEMLIKQLNNTPSVNLDYQHPATIKKRRSL